MKLYLVRHGDALPKDVDPERSLSDAGRAAVERVAAALKGRAQAERVYHSGKARARQTAEIIAAVMAPNQAIEKLSDIEPMDSPIPIAKQIEQWNQDTLVAGHLPFMGRLVALLVSGAEDPSIVSYEAGSMVCLEKNAFGGWTIAWMLTPKLFA